MTIRIADPRTDPEPAGWAAFRRKAALYPVWDYDLMRLEAWLARNPPLLMTAENGGEIIAAMSVLVCRPRVSPRYAPLPGTRTPRPVWAEVCQPWLSGSPGVVFAPGLGDREQRALTRLSERALVRRLGPGLMGVLYRALGKQLAEVVDGRGRLARVVDSTAILENRFTTEEDWVASLDSARRGSLRRQRRKLAADPTLIVKGGLGRDDLDGATLSQLVNRHRARYGKRPNDSRTPPAAAYLDSFVRRPDVSTLTYHDSDGTLLAVNTLLDHPECPALQHWAALSVEEGGRRHLYFDSYVRGVRYMAKKGAKELSAGRGMLELKTSLGFSPREVHAVAAPRPVLGR
jgi:hypothetical protein